MAETRVPKQGRAPRAEAQAQGGTARLPIPPRFDITALNALADGAEAMIDGLREKMLEPHPRKSAPVYNGSQLAHLCGIDPKHVTKISRRGDLPPGTVEGSRRIFTLVESRQWISALGPFRKRPPGAPGAAIACVNFKGGSTKTTTAFNLAQGLTLRGRRVLLVDLDAQASATTLTGMLPAAEVEHDQTAGTLVYPPLASAPKSLDHAIQSTYWDGLDLVPAAPHLYNAEILLPIHSQQANILWWDFINAALASARERYDVIIFDTAPALSYLAINAVVASDALLMPIPPETLDYASSVAFWSLLSETLQGLQRNRGLDKSFAFMRVLLSRVDSASMSAQAVRQWIRHTYGAHVLPVEIPKSPVNTASAMNFGSVYDIARYDGDARTYAKVRGAYDAFVAEIDDLITTTVWAPHEGLEGAAA